ncbi:hypothetical protein GF348_22580, partial [candidate division KSB3 bacterium]|nr:hypothetical protein [candidate division KSB3 bacterium]
MTPTYSGAGNPFGFTGRQLDWESALVHYRRREYDPELGRFISRDPLRLGSDGLSSYQYVQSRPTQVMDPSGMVSLEGLLERLKLFSKSQLYEKVKGKKMPKEHGAKDWIKCTEEMDCMEVWQALAWNTRVFKNRLDEQLGPFWPKRASSPEKAKGFNNHNRELRNGKNIINTCLQILRMLEAQGKCGCIPPEWGEF